MPVCCCSWQTDLEELISGFIPSSLCFTVLVVGVWGVNSTHPAELPGGCGDVGSEVTCVARDFLKCRAWDHLSPPLLYTTARLLRLFCFYKNLLKGQKEMPASIPPGGAGASGMQMVTRCTGHACGNAGLQPGKQVKPFSCSCSH